MGRKREGWCILRTSGAKTLSLAGSLGEDEFEVWTPIERLTMRRSRWNVSRNVRLPLLAGFVFAAERHLFDLLELERMPVKPRRGAGLSKPAHVAFHVLRDPLDPDGIPLVSDSALEPLREAEIPAKVKRRRSAFEPGDAVRVTSGSFEGMAAIVDRSDRRSAMVWVSIFGRHQRVDIPTSILRLDRAYALQSETDAAAKQAA